MLAEFLHFSRSIYFPQDCDAGGVRQEDISGKDGAKCFTGNNQIKLASDM